MKIKSPLALGRFIALALVTLFAAAVMWASGTKSTNGPPRTASSTEQTATADVAAPVVVRNLEASPVEILDVYSGMIRPYERYTMAFEIGGRIKELGQNQSGKDLDDGDIVREGQVLAVLDKRILRARVQETTAVLEQAQEELSRAKLLRNRANRVISETDFRKRVTEVAVAEAQAATALKNLEDATLVSPCDGRISRRYVSAGESLSMHAPVFEIVEVDHVLLVVGVPESRIHEIERQRQRLNTLSVQGGADRAGLKTYVQLMGSDRFGTRWPVRQGEVFRIGETADDQTGLFEVEILLDNSDGFLRPGSVALAKIVIDQLMGYRIPIQSVLFRGDTPYLYAVRESESDLRYMFWDLGTAADFQAHRVPLERFIEQERELIVPELPAADRRIVVRGQHRLVQDRRVRIVRTEADNKDTSDATARRDLNETRK